jgi:endonuclease YncB( thermonuclease family)
MGNKFCPCFGREKKVPDSQNIDEDQDRKLLLREDFKDLPLFSFEGQIKWAKITRVIDADTVEIIHYLPNTNPPTARKDILRLYGFDAPEKRPRKLSPTYVVEKKAAVVATTIVSKLVQRSNHVVTVHFYKAEKYGRQLGEVFLHFGDISKNNFNLQEWLVKHRVVKPYFGKTKEEWQKEELQSIIDREDILLHLCEL